MCTTLEIMTDMDVVNYISKLDKNLGLRIECYIGRLEQRNERQENLVFSFSFSLQRRIWHRNDIQNWMRENGYHGDF